MTNVGLSESLECHCTIQDADPIVDTARPLDYCLSLSQWYCLNVLCMHYISIMLWYIMPGIIISMFNVHDVR